MIWNRPLTMTDVGIIVVRPSQLRKLQLKMKIWIEINRFRYLKKSTRGTLDEKAKFKSTLPMLFDYYLRTFSLVAPSFRQVVHNRQKWVADYRSDFPSIQMKNKSEG